MIGKIISVMLVIAILSVSFGIIYDNLPREPVSLKKSNIVPTPIELVDYGSVPVFADNLRFNHNHISYFIEKNCDGPRRGAMIEAFDFFSEKMGIISFYEVSGDADIDVGCSNDYIPIDEHLFAAGEGGPSRIINTSVFKTIEKGKISLYDDPRCDYPVVEIHELAHVFGFDHSDDPKNIMYHVSDCDQEISDDMIKLINDLYSIEPLADLSVSDVSAVQKGKYLDFNITILNEGMVDVDFTDLTIVVNGEEIQVMNVSEIGIGYGQNLRATNVRLPSRNIRVIDFVVDKGDIISELNEENNVVQVISD